MQIDSIRDSSDFHTKSAITVNNAECLKGSLKVDVEVMTGSSESIEWFIFDGDETIAYNYVVHEGSNQLFWTEFCLKYGIYKFKTQHISPESGGSAKLYSNGIMLFEGNSFISGKVFSVCNNIDGCGDIVYAGDFEALVIRVISNDSETSLSQSELSGLFFAEDDISMRTQFLECSYKKFTTVPFHGLTITNKSVNNGVVDITIGENTNGQTAGAVLDTVITTANAVLGELDSQFSFVIVCLPPSTLIGSSSDWKAYAFINAKISVYNDRQCSYLSVQMHELGHNLGLSHSNSDTNYGDETGYMGISYAIQKGPQKCFNGPKTWSLGWYSTGHVLVNTKADISNSIYRVTKIENYNPVYLNFFPESASFILLKLINSETGYDYYVSFSGRVLITKRESGYFYADSTLVAAIGAVYTETSYTIYNVDDGVHLQISVMIRPGGQYADVKLVKFTPCLVNDDCNDNNSCTSDECNTSTGECIFTPLSCNECGSMVDISVYTNSDYDQVIWSIIDAGSNNIVRSSGYYEEAQQKYSFSDCVEYGNYKYDIIFSGDASSISTNFSLTVGNSLVDEGELVNETMIETFFTICSSDEDCFDYNGCTIDQCNNNARLCVNTEVDTENCSNCKWLTLDITTDNYPDETTWDIYDFEAEVVVLSGSPYPMNVRASGRRKSNGRRKAPTRVSSLAGKSNEAKILASDDEERIYERICLENEVIYHFKIMDSFGDGICCAEGEGSYLLSVEENELRRGGSFLESDEFFYEFNSVSDDCNHNTLTLEQYVSEISTCVYRRRDCEEYGTMVYVDFKTDEHPLESRWNINQYNVTLLSGGPYVTSFRDYQATACLPFGMYSFDVYDIGGNGLTTCDIFTCGFYRVSTSNTEIIVNDGSFSNENHQMFGICYEHSQCDDDNECTIDSCDVDTKTCVFDLNCESCKKKLVTIGVNTDVYGYHSGMQKVPQETTWTLTNSNNEIVSSGGPYSYYSTFYKHHYCLTADLYVFNIFDVANDGLCYDRSDLSTCGNYTISVGNDVVVEGDGDFAQEEHKPFEVTSITSSLSEVPSGYPSSEAIVTSIPSVAPTEESNQPSKERSYPPSILPSQMPSMEPSTFFPLLNIEITLLPFKVPSEAPSNYPSQEKTQPPSAPHSDSPSQAVAVNPSKIPSSSPSLISTQSPSFMVSERNPRNHQRWHIEFDKVYSGEQNKIIFEYLLPHDISSKGHFISTILDQSCTIKQNETSIYVSNAAIAEINGTMMRKGITDVKLDYSSIKNSDLWNFTSSNSGSISFCMRSELVLNDAYNTSVSFSETNFISYFNFEKGFHNLEIKNFTLSEANVQDVKKSTNLKVSACIYDLDNKECDAEKMIFQNYDFSLYIQPLSSNSLVKKIEYLNIYQNGVLKMSPILDGKNLNPLITEVWHHDSSIIITTQLLSMFFYSQDPSDIIISGSTMVEFKSKRRSLLFEADNYHGYSSFELRMKIGSPNLYKQETKDYICLFSIIFFIVMLRMILKFNQVKIKTQNNYVLVSNSDD